jgi:prevent-host-death family protein
MQTITANDAKTRFGELIDRVQREPVRVTRRNRIVGVMVSAQDYDAMRDFYADRLSHTLRETADEAGRKGLTGSELQRLLADDE